MTDAISGLYGSTAATSTAGTSTAATSAGGSQTADRTQLDKDAFLKLLVAQLKYQDPTKPVDSSQFLAQTAQFTLVEKFEQLSTSTAELLSTTRAQSAAALVGRAISWLDADGATRSGTVDSVSLVGGTPTLKVGDSDVALTSVTEVAAAG